MLVERVQEDQRKEGYTRYDERISKEFELSKQLLFHSVIEEHSFFKVLGDVNGLRVLDLGCGNGHYTRAIYERGAKEVVGVDVSTEMITLAEEKERGLAQPRNVRYHVSDVSSMSIVGSGNWDVVTAVYLFCYAPTVADLQKYLQSVYDNIAPGGRLVFANGNWETDDSTAWGLRTKKYGYVRTALTSTTNGGKDGRHAKRDGDSFQIEFFTPGREPFHIVNYYYSRETYKLLCDQIGFKSVRWIPFEISEEGYELMKHVPGYWDDMLTNRAFEIVEAIK